MQTDAFWDAISELERLVAKQTIAIMCAEAVPWRCHRSLVADALVVVGVEVRHITGMQEPSPHRMTPFAVVREGRITYPQPDTLAL